MSASPFPEYFGRVEAARWLNVHPRTVSSLIARGRLAAQKVFNVWLVHERDLQALVESGYTGRPGPREK